MSIERGEGERQVHLRDYWRTIWSGRWTIAAVFVVVVTIGILATVLATRVYRATATLEINPRTQRVVKVDDVSQIGATGMGWSAEDRYFRTQLEVLRSRDVAERAFRQLGLESDPQFATARDPVARFMARLEVEPTPDTLVVAVSAEGSDPNQVAAWVNAVSDAYVARNFEQASRATSDAISALLKQMTPLRESLLSREQEKFNYAREQKVYIPEAQTASYNERLVSLGKDYTATKLRRLELEAVFRKIEEIDRARGDYSVIPQVAKDEALRALVGERGQLEAEQRRLLVIFKPGHQKVKENEAGLAKVSQRIQAETERIISAIRTEYALAESRETDLAAEIQRTLEEALDMSRKSSTYNILKAESEEARKVFDLVMQRVKEVDLNASLLRNNLEVLDRAIVPTAPVRPRRVVNVAVAVLLGLGLGVGLVFFLEYLDNTVRGAEQIERDFGLATLAVVPRRTAAAEPALKEAFSSLRTGVHFCSMARARRVLLVTSASPQDGKTLTAVNLARAMARAGDSVCLVDADLRRPSVHEVMALSDVPGLTNHLAGEPEGASWRSVARPRTESQPAVIPSGPLPPSPAELLASDRFAALIKDLKAAHDWVIVDSPPTAGLTDALLLAAQTDMVVFVVRQNRTDRDALRRALDSVRTANPNIIGAVLNDVDLARSENRELYYPAYDPRAARDTEGTAGSRRRSAAL
jgi:capsular exopolysaccharide synthesis family protein